jgi:hypothetical protein
MPLAGRQCVWLATGWLALSAGCTDNEKPGSDSTTTDADADADAEVMDYYRTLLGQIDPAAADKIAHENARALFGL